MGLRRKSRKESTKKRHEINATWRTVEEMESVQQKRWCSASDYGCLRYGTKHAALKVRPNLSLPQASPDETVTIQPGAQHLLKLSLLSLSY
jgi:hypothetical protein